jgi:hypothetical protein
VPPLAAARLLHQAARHPRRRNPFLVRTTNQHTTMGCCGSKQAAGESHAVPARPRAERLSLQWARR